MYKDWQTYSTNVLMGNWVEESCLEAERMELYWAKRKRYEMLAKNGPTNMHDNLLRPVILNAVDDFLRYGQDVQILSHVTPETYFPGPAAVTSSPDSGGGVSLSCGIHSEQLATGLGAGSPVTASPFTKPCVRNCFKIRGLRSGCEDGELLKFGDIFAISPCVSSESLFVTAAVPRLNTKRGMSGVPTLKLTDALNEHCRWTAVYWNVALQMEAEGLAIPNGFRVILKQMSTNQNVAVEADFRQSTIFGNEYEVSAHSYTDFRGRDKNIWRIVTSLKEQPWSIEDDKGSWTNNE